MNWRYLSTKRRCIRLKLWCQKVLSLVAVVKALEKDKEHLRINLHMAEEEVKLIFEENKVLDVENKRLLRLYQKERNHSASGGKHTDSASAKMGQRENNSFDSFILCVGLL